jgi:hypothetical protein
MSASCRRLPDILKARCIWAMIFAKSLLSELKGIVLKELSSLSCILFMGLCLFLCFFLKKTDGSA